MRPRLRFLPLVLPLLLLLASSSAFAVEIWEVQGSSATSPHVGQRVELRGNVMTLNTGGGPFFIQTPPARSDNDPATSDGIAISAPFNMRPSAMKAGSVVDIVGNVQESNGVTTITATSLTLTGEVMPVPEPVAIEPGFSEFERLEGMFISIDGIVVEPPVKQVFRIAAGSRRPFREPGANWDQNPEILNLYVMPFTSIDPFCCAFDFVAGATFKTTGVMHAEGSAYQILPVHGWPTFVNPTYPRAVRPARAGEMTLATQNLYQFFDDRDDPSIKETVATAEAWRTRLALTSKYVREILRNPDVLAVQEVESQAALDDIAKQLAADDASLRYTAYVQDGNDVGGIDIGFLVRDTVRVDSVQQFGKDDRWTPPTSTSPQLLHDRPPLVLRGAYLANGAPFPFVAIAVHLRSLSGIEDSNAAFVRAKRHEAALRLSQYVQSLQNAEPGVRLIVAGDFNAFEFSDGYADVLGQISGRPDTSVPTEIPASDVVNPDLTDWVLSLPQAERYSYVFRGNAQVLDHILTSAPLAAFVRGFHFARVNADATTNLPGSMRISDHEPAVLYVMTDSNADGKPDDLGATAGSRRRSTRH